MSSNEGYEASLETIKQRAQNVRDGQEPSTYVERLMADPNKRRKKLGEEVAELISENVRPNFNPVTFVGEAADTIFSAEVMAIARDADFLEILSLMETFKTLGQPPEEKRAFLRQNPEELTRTLGGTAAVLVMDDSRTEFQTGRFLAGVTGVVALTELVMESRGMTLQPVFAELAVRNIPAQASEI
jgi:phosphoribosyl-ATP pyrophosphohydrolase